MNELKIFENPEFGKVRALERDGEPWFVAADVCRYLEIKNPTDTLKRLDDDERARFNLGHPMNETNFVNEYGLYSLVLGSRKKEAKAFKRWITHEVIPSIRKTGGYTKPESVQLAALAQSQAMLMQALSEQARTQAELAEAVKALAGKVEALENNRPAIVCPKDPPVVSLTGLAKVIINTRRILLDKGSSAEDIWKVTRSILNSCGFSVPYPGFIQLEDFF